MTEDSLIITIQKVDKDTETAEGLVGTVIATDGIAVIVNNDNPTDELTSEQVKAIYTGEALTWDEVNK